MRNFATFEVLFLRRTNPHRLLFQAAKTRVYIHDNTRLLEMSIKCYKVLFLCCKTSALCLFNACFHLLTSCTNISLFHRRNAVLCRFTAAFIHHTATTRKGAQVAPCAWFTLCSLVDHSLFRVSVSGIFLSTPSQRG